MSCCDRPEIKSSTYADWCENCGWAFSYLSGDECEYENCDTRSFAQIVYENNGEES